MDVSGTIESVLGQKGAQLWSVGPEATVFDAIQLMAEKNVGALLVLRDAELLGVVSERDYTRKVILQGKSSRTTPVREIMSSELTVVKPGESVQTCMRMMTEKRVRHLPVHDGQSIRGVVSIGDLVKWIMSSQAATIDHLEHYIAGGYPG